MNRFRTMAKRSLLVPSLIALLVSPLVVVLQTSPAFANDYPKMTALARLKLQDGLKIVEHCANLGGSLYIQSGHGDAVDSTWKMADGKPSDPVQNVSVGNTSFILPGYYQDKNSITCAEVFPRYSGYFGISDAKQFLTDAGYSDWNEGFRTFSGGCNNQRATEWTCLRFAILKRVDNYRDDLDPQMHYIRNKMILDARIRGNDPGGCYVHWTSQTAAGQLDIPGWLSQYPHNGNNDDEVILGTVADPTIIRLVNDSTNPTGYRDYFAMSEGGDGSGGWQKTVNISVGIQSNTGANVPANTMKCVELANELNAVKEDGTSVSEEYKGWWAQLEDEFKTGTGATSGADTTGTLEDKPTCAIEGIGWILCPVVNSLAKLADGAFGFIANNFLRTPPQLFNTDSGTYQAWQVMRDFANAAFVIAFLVIIFSQLTNFGVSNYGIKKMLPRLIVAAILVNLSFFICQIAVDLSNILGYSIRETLSSLGGQVNDFDPSSLGSSTTGEGALGLLGASTAILIAGAAVIWVGLAAFIPILITALIALVTIFFILLARQALIVLLIVVAPLAFVAFLLPNTGPWFKKWQKTFTTMLLLFPIISIVFGASSLAGDVLSTAFSGIPSAGIEHENWWGTVLAAAVTTLPLFVVPSILKKSLDTVGGLGGKINNLSNKLRDRGQKAVDPYVQQKRQERQAERAAGTRSMFGAGIMGRRDPDAARRRTVSQRFAQNRKSREGKIENLKSRADNQWQGLATDGAAPGANRGVRRTARMAQAVLQEKGALGEEKSALEARTKELVAERRNTEGTRENTAFQRRRTSEIVTGQQEKRAEGAFMNRVNQEQGRTFEAIQDTKLAESAIRAAEATQESYFKVRQAGSIGTGNESDQIRRTQLQADETTAAMDANIQAANKIDVAEDAGLQALRNVKSFAEDRGALADQQTATRLDERVAAAETPETQDQAEIRNLTTASKQAQATAGEAIQRSYGDAVLDRGGLVHAEAVGSLPEDVAHGTLRAEAYGRQVVDSNRKKIVDATKELATPAAAAAVQAGITRAPDGSLVYPEMDENERPTGRVFTTATPEGRTAIKNRLTVYGAIPFGAPLESFSPSDQASLTRVQDYAPSPEGAEAIATKLADSKGAKIQGIRRIVEAAPVAERPAIVAAFNAAARSAGLDYAASNSVDANGNFVFYGAGGETAAKLGESLVAKGLQNIPTPALFDDTVREAGGLTARISETLARAGTDPATPEFQDLAYSLRDLPDDKMLAIARAADSENYRMSGDELKGSPAYLQLVQLRRTGQQVGR